MESKIDIYKLIPQKYYPKTVIIKQNSDLNAVISTIKSQDIQIPFITKPDIGLRGSGVKKIKDVEDLKTYHQNADFDFLAQSLIPFANEVGIFYVRHPHKKTGKITGIVSKEFMQITGDGVLSIRALIKKNPRYQLQIAALKKEFGAILDTILPKNEKFNLLPYGNHARGAKFIDCSHWNNENLTKTINEVCLQIPGFFYGRLDIMYNSIEELSVGENFLIVEINGAASEPTHIYDPKHSIFFAWKELARHINMLYKISSENKALGYPYLTFREGVGQYKLHLKQNKRIVNF